MGFGDVVADALLCMRKERIIYKDFVSNAAMEKGERLVKSTRGLWEDVLDKIVVLLHQEIPREYPNQAVWWYSVLCDMKKDPDIFLEFVKYIRSNEKFFSPNTLYFLYYQCKGIWFITPELDKIEIKKELWKLFLDIVEKFSELVSTSLEHIPYEKRNHGFIIVITEQYTNWEHGPTKTALDRCKVLIDKMEKEVLLINSAEIWSNVGAIPFSNVAFATYAMGNQDVQFWKGTQIPYFKCERDMPDIESLDRLLMWIRELAPEWIISIGGSSILSNLANKIIPALTVGLTPADLEFTSNRYQTLSRKLEDIDVKSLQMLGFGREHVIESIFTSGLKPQTEKINRNDLGIAEEKFLILVVGTRLDSEVSDEFLEIMDETLSGDMHLGFLGAFEEYFTRIQKYPNLIQKTSYLGYCKDILSRMELGDLYLNPLRKGGGTSCVEAMYKGLPVVTIAYGDVAANAGEEFCVRDYLEMQKEVIHYYNDTEHYHIMSDKARKRAEILMDTEGEFVRILQELEKRESLKK